MQSSLYPSLHDLPPTVLVDTCILRDLVWFLVRPREARQFLPSSVDVQRMQVFLQGRKERLTTAHVFVEIDKALQREFRGDGLRRARGVAFPAFAGMFAEATQAVAGIDFEIIATVGITDAAVLEVCRSREGCALLTGDRQLQSLARRRGVNVLSEWEILSHPDLGR